MKVHALNEMQGHYEKVQKEVQIHGEVTLKGYLYNGFVQLLEGSHRIAAAIELGLPITIILYNKDEIIGHDCGIYSETTGLTDRSTVLELVEALLADRERGNYCIYDTDEHPNIKIISNNSSGMITEYFHTHVKRNSAYTLEENQIADIIKNPMNAFHRRVAEVMSAIKPLHSSKVCVIAQNDGRAAFALHLLGAEVTCVFSDENQMQQALNIAKTMNWSIRFIYDSIIDINKLQDNEFDCVYVAENVIAGISDLNAMYGSCRRILKPDALLVTFDVHPFMHMFKYSETQKIEVQRAYDDLRPQGSDNMRFWRMSEIMNCIAANGMKLYAVLELQSNYDWYGSCWYDSEESRIIDNNRLCDWQYNSLAAIPQWLSVFAFK